MPDTLAPQPDPTLRALALANAGLAVSALAAHLAEAAELDAEEVAEQLLNAGLQVLMTRRRPEDARILAELCRWIDGGDEPAAATGRPLTPDPAAPWSWHPSPEGDLVLLGAAGAEAARIQVYRRTVLDAADPDADEPYHGAWIAAVRPPDPDRPPWRLTATSLADAYARTEAAIGRQTTRWHHPAAEVPA